MKDKKLNAVRVWKQMEDLLVPQLRLTLIERAVYSHLVRHSRLEGKQRLRFSIAEVGRGACLSVVTVRKAVRRLVQLGALRLVRRSKAGHVVEVRLPEEIRAARVRDGQTWLSGACGREPRRRADGRARALDGHALAATLEETDFMQSTALRQAIHLREHGQCYYCLRRLTNTVRCLDHVVPRARSGRNSYRNLVSCCLECNSRKGERAARDFLRWLYREGRLTAVELSGRLRALHVLASGKLRPRIESLRRSHLARAKGTSLHLDR
jgi:HNH endonuclease